MRGVEVDAVSEVVERTAREVVVPAFRALAAGDVEEKSPGEVVTRVDRECEVLLSQRLRALRDVPVVGEEAAAADPSLLALVAGADAAWVVDPLDGTACFVEGSEEHAVLVALVERGEAVASWVHQPATGRTWAAERGAGARSAGGPVTVPAPPAGGALRLAALTRFLPTDARSRAEAAATAPARRSAGWTYPDVVEGHVDAVLFWRTLPWDHAAGALLVEEAGGSARRPDGSRYQPGDGRSGLLVASGGETWQRARAALLG